MADQAITALPKKTYSGSSKIAATDYLLGIDSAEGYQMLIQDLGEYIINRVTASLAGSNQTLAAAISALNSNLVIEELGGAATREEFETAIKSAITSATAYRPKWISITHNFVDAPFEYAKYTGYILKPAGTGINAGIVLTYGNAVISGYYNNGTLTWYQQPTRAEMDAVSSKLSLVGVNSVGSWSNGTTANISIVVGSKTFVISVAADGTLSGNVINS